MPIEDVATELVVRYLDAWVPTSLHSSKRVTFVQSWPRIANPGAAEAVVRVFNEFADQLRGRRVSLAFIAPELGDAATRLSALQVELDTPSQLAVHAVTGSAATHLAAVLAASQSAGAPILAYIDVTLDELPVRAIAAGRPAEVLMLAAHGSHDTHAGILRDNGFTLVSTVELVTEDDARLLVFGTSSAKSLEAFKNGLWQLDEYAGVSIRDPHDKDGHLLDISLSPHPGPLRRQILDHLAAVGERNVTEIRRFALTETVYRVSDVTQVLTNLVTSGAVTRRPEHGRLSGDTMIGPVLASR